MKKYYIGCKMLQAEPCVKVNGKIYDSLPDMDTREGHIIEYGYKVRYEDGYESFSPKSVFEKAYVECDEYGFVNPESFVDTYEKCTTVGGIVPDGMKAATIRGHLVNGEMFSVMKAEMISDFDKEYLMDKAWKQLIADLQIKLNFLTRWARLGIKNRKFETSQNAERQ